MRIELLDSIKPLINEYGIFMPYLFLLVLILLLSRVTVYGVLFKKPSELSYPKWLINEINSKNNRNGIFNALIALIFFAFGWFTDLLVFNYIAWLTLGISFAFLSFGIFHYFFPTSKIVTKVKRGKLTIFDASIFVLISFYFFVDYMQLIWPTLTEDPSPDGEGVVRVMFYFTGMSFWSVLVPLIILTIGRHRLNIISVILLLSFSIWLAYTFLNYLFQKVEMTLESYVFSFIISFAITIFVLENINFFITNKESTD